MLSFIQDPPPASLNTVTSTSHSTLLFPAPPLAAGSPWRYSTAYRLLKNGCVPGNPFKQCPRKNAASPSIRSFLALLLLIADVPPSEMCRTSITFRPGNEEESRASTSARRRISSSRWNWDRTPARVRAKAVREAAGRRWRVASTARAAWGWVSACVEEVEGVRKTHLRSHLFRSTAVSRERRMQSAPPVSVPREPGRSADAGYWESWSFRRLTGVGSAGRGSASWDEVGKGASRGGAG